MSQHSLSTSLSEIFDPTISLQSLSFVDLTYTFSSSDLFLAPTSIFNSTVLARPSSLPSFSQAIDHTISDRRSSRVDVTSPFPSSVVVPTPAVLNPSIASFSPQFDFSVSLTASPDINDSVRAQPLIPTNFVNSSNAVSPLSSFWSLTDTEPNLETSAPHQSTQSGEINENTYYRDGSDPTDVSPLSTRLFISLIGYAAQERTTTGNVGLISGIVVGVLVLCAIAVTSTILVLRRKEEVEEEKEETSNELQCETDIQGFKWHNPTEAFGREKSSFSLAVNSFAIQGNPQAILGFDPEEYFV
jgi:protein-tyrosine phosphatase